jgi:hypothetical protein
MQQMGWGWIYMGWGRIYRARRLILQGIEANYAEPFVTEENNWKKVRIIETKRNRALEPRGYCDLNERRWFLARPFDKDKEYRWMRA